MPHRQHWLSIMILWSLMHLFQPSRQICDTYHQWLSMINGSISPTGGTMKCLARGPQAVQHGDMCYPLPICTCPQPLPANASPAFAWLVYHAAGIWCFSTWQYGWCGVIWHCASSKQYQWPMPFSIRSMTYDNNNCANGDCHVTNVTRWDIDKAPLRHISFDTRDSRLCHIRRGR